jgi:predicted amidohydrolase YtcJ
MAYALGKSSAVWEILDMSSPAEMILFNGKIISVDATFSIADSIAIAEGRVLAIGARGGINACRGAETRCLDLRGRAVLPGLIDGHAHMDREGLKSVFPSLGTVHSIRDIQDRIAVLAHDARPGDWIVTMPIGTPPYYFDVLDLLAEKRWPTRLELDEAAPRNPVFIRPIWGLWRHTLPLVSCANSLALAHAGITRETVSPIETLEIVRDAGGYPTGVFIEHDFQPLVELLYFRDASSFTRAQRAATLPAAARAYHEFGTTSIFEEHGAAAELLRAYRDAQRAGTLTMRTSLVFSPNWKAAGDVSFGRFIEAWAGWLGEPALGDDMLKMSGLFVDLGPTLANELRATASPYTGWAGFNYNTGLPREKAIEVLRACAENDIRPAVIRHDMLDLYEEIDRDIPLAGRRWVIGHISTLTQRDVERIARMGLVVTSHTNRYIYKEGHLQLQRLPAERHDEIVPLRWLVDAGVKVSLATDNVPVSLFWPVWESVSRRCRYTEERIAPGQALTREEALCCATINGAFLTFDENKKGSLEPGKLADLTVLSEDPLLVDESRLCDIRSLMTIVGGAVVYETGEWVF